MQCKEVEAVFEQEGLATLPEGARAHLTECSACQSFFSDLSTIVDLAHELPAEVEPPDRVWIALRGQLEREGILKTPASSAVERAPWWQVLGEFFRTRAMAAGAVGALILIAFALLWKNPSPPVLQANDTFADTAVLLSQQEQDLANMRLASTSTVDTSLRQSLQDVDEFIAEGERRMKEEPQDNLTREYLSGAYQQKAELLSAMMDRGGSIN